MNTAPIFSGLFGIAFLLGFVIGGFLFESLADNRWQNEIESRGYAEYYLDENHEPQWRWLEAQEPQD